MNVRLGWRIQLYPNTQPQLARSQANSTQTEALSSRIKTVERDPCVVHRTVVVSSYTASIWSEADLEALIKLLEIKMIHRRAGA